MPGRSGMKWGKHLFGDRDYDPIGEEAKGPRETKKQREEKDIAKNIVEATPDAVVKAVAQWGTKEHPYDTANAFLEALAQFKAGGGTDKEFGDYLGLSSSNFRDMKSAAKNDVLSENIKSLNDMINRGNSLRSAAAALGVPEATARGWLSTKSNKGGSQIDSITSELRNMLADGKYVDIGEGSEYILGVSTEKLRAAVKKLETEGYHVINYYQRQMTSINKTQMKVLVPADVESVDVRKDKSKISPPLFYMDSSTGKAEKFERPRSISSNRVQVLAADDPHPLGGVGIDRDGLIEVRRGVPELSLGKANYAQVRILVDGNKYLKGMCVYAPEGSLPDGIDVRFNSNKPTAEKGYKEAKSNPNNPFGANIKEDDELMLAQRHYIDKDGNRQLSCLNIVSEEGTWFEWSKSLASQVLSKQRIDVIKRQLDSSLNANYRSYLKIMEIENEDIRAKMLDDLAGKIDQNAVALKGAAFNRQAAHVIIPNPDLKPGEIYAPNYRDGESCVLIRFPHGGLFEIPAVKVNNKSKSSKELIGNSIDAICMNPVDAKTLSGADFDGDTVQVIPNNDGAMIRMEAQKDLQDFDPGIYKLGNYPNEKPLKNKERGYQYMGSITNLITDMSMMGADVKDLVAATKFSMVAIDAWKHGYAVKPAWKELGIDDLIKKYRHGKRGASTIISRTKSPVYVPEQRLVTNKYEVPKDRLKDWEAGKPVYIPTGRKKFDKKTGEYVVAQMTVDKGSVQDPRNLVGHLSPKEDVYADFAYNMHELANSCRKEARMAAAYQKDVNATNKYADAVESIKAKVISRKRKSPYERLAQLIAEADLQVKISDAPELTDNPKELKKAAAASLERARKKIQLTDVDITLTDEEWEALFSNALTSDMFNYVLRHCDPIELSKRALHESDPVMSENMVKRINEMSKNGYSRLEIAEHTGFTLKQLKEVIKE